MTKAARWYAESQASAQDKEAFGIVVKYMFYASLEVSDSSNRCAVLRISDVKWNTQLDLTSSSDTFLESPAKLTVSLRTSGTSKIPGEDDLVFRVGLLGDEGPGKVEIGRWPIFLAESSEVSDHELDLLLC